MADATYIEIHFQDGSRLYVDRKGALGFHGHGEDAELPRAEMTPKQVFDLIWDKLDRYRVVREALGLKKNEKLSRAILGETREW